MQWRASSCLNFLLLPRGRVLWSLFCFFLVASFTTTRHCFSNSWAATASSSAVSSAIVCACACACACLIVQLYVMIEIVRVGCVVDTKVFLCRNRRRKSTRNLFACWKTGMKKAKSIPGFDKNDWICVILRTVVNEKRSNKNGIFSFLPR